MIILTKHDPNLIKYGFPSDTSAILIITGSAFQAFRYGVTYEIEKKNSEKNRQLI